MYYLNPLHIVPVLIYSVYSNLLMGEEKLKKYILRAIVAIQANSLQMEIDTFEHINMSIDKTEKNVFAILRK